MALKLVHHQQSHNLLVIAGYESGFTAVHVVPCNTTGIRAPTPDLARTIYLSRPHTQPILSVDALPDGSSFFTSSADAIIAAHRIPDLHPNSGVEHDQIKSAPSHTVGGEPALPQSPNMSKDAAQLNDPESNLSPSYPKIHSSPSPSPSALSTLLASAPPQQNLPQTSTPPPPLTPQPPHKAINTKHSGQQSLRVRPDGRLLATAGWDARIRIYSAKTLKEVAVLKWHKEGVYAVWFGDVLCEGGRGEAEGEGKKETGLQRLQRQREEAVQRRHWVVAGAKDGRVSLWEVF